MESQAKKNLVVTGTTEGFGGTYNAVKIFGEGKWNGDLVCEFLRCYGTAAIDGHTRAKIAKIFGTVQFTGGYETHATSIFGEAKIEGDVSFGRISCLGTVTVHGTMSGDTVKLKGELKASKDVEAERFVGQGSFVIDGLLNAGEINIQLYGGCKAREIGGEQITFKKGGPLQQLTRLFGSHPHSSLTADTIEGDHIYLEQTKATIVRGNRVTIGPGCVIERVEYKDEISLDKGAKVTQHIRV